MSPTRPRLHAVPQPGRLALRGVLPGAGPAALAMAGRQALAQVRAALLAPRPGPADDLLRAARQAGWPARCPAVHLSLEDPGGGSASLTWRHDGGTEVLRWSHRGGSLPEDGACQGSAGVAAALAR